MSNAFEQLVELVRQLPGIGPRQARRLAYFLVHRDRGWVNEFARALTTAREHTHTCPRCMRSYVSTAQVATCTVCADPTRDASTLMLIEKDVDFENIERAGVYKGVYFILGGTTSLLDKEPEKRVRIHALLERVARDATMVREIIFALSATTEGEDTATYVREKIMGIGVPKELRLTVLGRGLSTGAELEYVDADTFASALAGRG